jgi:hypothetical protein
VNAITLRNPSRVLVPLISLGLVALMYVPVLVMTTTDHGEGHIRYALGTTAFLFCMAWLGYSGLRAPHTAVIEPSGLTLRRILGTWRYEPGELVSWSFARDGAPPDQTPPDPNGLLMLRMRDGSKFRAEVTRDEAVALIAMLPKTATLSRL